MLISALIVSLVALVAGYVIRELSPDEKITRILMLVVLVLWFIYILRLFNVV
jgi:Ca2+/Na+ antiporter